MLRLKLSAMIVAATDFLQAVSTILAVQEKRVSALEIAPSLSRFPAISAEEKARSRRHNAWRERIAEHDAMDPYQKQQLDPYSTGMAEFIGGPLNDQIHAMSEALPTFYWAEALPSDWTMFLDENDPADFPEVDKFTYERQFFYSSTGNAVYLCSD